MRFPCAPRRWFPKGIVIFVAPTKPLVQQQIGSCHGVTGISQSRTCQLNGSVKPERRARLWQEHSFFFATPQTVQQDLESAIVPVDRVTCIVFDEAHKATGNYAYVKIIEYMEQSEARYRVLGLSATPGQDKNKINEVIKNLRAAKIDYRTESDVSEYTNRKKIECIIIKQPEAIEECAKALEVCLSSHLQECEQLGIVSKFSGGMSTHTPFVAFKAKQEWYDKHNGNDGRKHMYNGHFDILMLLFNLKGSLHSYGITITLDKIRKHNFLKTKFSKKYENGLLFTAFIDTIKKAMELTQSQSQPEENVTSIKVREPTRCQCSTVFTN